MGGFHTEGKFMAKSRGELELLHADLCADARAIMRKKNIDYAQEGNPYENFETFGLLGILVRLSDKLARLRRYVENGGKFAVEDEGRVDTVRDAINYLVLFEGMAQREAMRKNPAS